MSPQKKFDVIVLGGGIIGALSAFELAKHGIQVGLIDKYKFLGGASANSAAMLETQLDAHRGEPFLSLARASATLFPSLHQEILSLTGIDFQYEVCGILQLAISETEATALKNEAARQKKMGFDATWMTPEEIKTKIPDISISFAGGIFFAEDGQVNGIRFLEGALKAAEKRGAVLIDSAGEIELTVEEGKVIGVKTKSAAYEAKTVVVATGAWTDPLLTSLGISLGIEPIRGQLAVYETPPALFPFPVYTEKDGYITPKRDGTTLAGTTVEHAGFDTSTTEGGKEKIVKHAHSLVSSMKKFPLRKMTAGLRPKSPSDLPLLGRLESHPDLIIASGHYRNGVLLAPITAKIVRALVLGEKPPVDLAPFSPRPQASKS